MGKITMDQAKELETKKEELLEGIKDFSEKIISEKEALLERIHTLKHAVKDKESKQRLSDLAEEDIYNVDNIIHAGEQNNVEEMKKNIKLLYRGYAVNPYCDKRKAERAIALLDELGKVTKDLDKFYNDNVKEAYEKVRVAKLELSKTLSERTEYRRKVLSANDYLKEAARYDKVGANELRKYGADPISSGRIMGVANCAMDGKEIVSITKTAISHERKIFDEMKNVEFEKQITDPMGASLIAGEPYLMFGSYTGVPENAGVPKGNPLKDFVSNIFK